MREEIGFGFTFGKTLMTALRKCQKLVVLVALAMGAAAADCWAGSPPARGPAAEASAGAGGGAAQELLNRLNSNNPAEREAGQRQAALIFDALGNRDMLQKLSETADDEDVKDLLRARAALLKSQDNARHASVLPPISLHVKDASLQDVLDTLNKSVNSALGFDAVTDAGFADRFNLDVADKPFWEVFAALYQQHPLSLTAVTGSNAGVRVSTARSKSAAYAIDGSFMAFVNTINLQRSVGGAADGSGRQATLSLDTMLAFDPRLEVYRIQQPRLVRALDDREQTYSPATPPSGPALYVSTGPIPAYASKHTLAVPAEMGKTLSFALETNAEVYLVSGAVAIADVEHNINQMVTLGSRTYRVSRFGPVSTPSTPRGAAAATAPVQYSVMVVWGDAPSGPPPSPSATLPGHLGSLTQFRLRDGTGRAIWRGSGGTNVMNAWTGTFMGTTGPYKLEITDNTGTALLPIRLQFKDVPLP